MRYRRSEKGRATWRKQRERRRRIEAEKRAERLRAAGLLPGVKLCRSGLHQYDPATAPKVRGHAICPECRRAARARYKGGASRRAAVARYNLSEKAPCEAGPLPPKRKGSRDAGALPAEQEAARGAFRDNVTRPALGEQLARSGRRKPTGTTAQRG